jgi:hypothetical protein
MTEIIDDIILELENKITIHNTLAIMYEGQEDDISVDKHYTAVFAYEKALQIIKKHYNKERMLKFIK